jgi:hypothetical protein
MSCLQPTSTIDRLFTKLDVDRVDEFGFLDHSRTPRLLRFDRVLNEPLAWVLGPPWLGKSTVANAIDDWLRLNPEALGGIEDRHALARLGEPWVDRDVPPVWWQEWRQHDTARPAVWLIDGVDEGLDRNEHLFHRILGVIDDVPADRLRQLRLILFSRPHAELGNFRDKLQSSYAGIYQWTESPLFWLTRLDREAAEAIVGRERFPEVLDLIGRCNLQTVAGYPIVLCYLKRYPETGGLSVPKVWLGILTALLGEKHTNTRARFDTTPPERFDAACRIAAMLTLTRRDTIRGHSPDPDVLTTGTLFQNPNNRLLAAAQETCQTAAFQHLPEQGAFRFTQRNIQDWFTAFALQRLPLPALRSALTGPNGALIPRLSEPARLIHASTGRQEVRAEIDRLGGGLMLPSDVTEPTLVEAIRCLDRLEELARDAPGGLWVGADWRDDLGRLRVEGLGTVLVGRLRDPARPHQVKQLLIEVAEATRSLEAVEPAVELVLDGSQREQLRYQAMRLVARFGGPTHLRHLEGPIGEGTKDADIDRQIRGMLINELLDRGMWPIWKAALYIPPVDTNLLDRRVSVLERLNRFMTIDDARCLLPHLRTLSLRHADEFRPDRFPDFISRAIDILLTQEPAARDDLNNLIEFALELAPEAVHWLKARDVAIRLRNYPFARRRFYENDVEALQSGRNDRRILARTLLHHDDWRWLRDQALGPWAGHREVWDDAYWMARRARDEGCLPLADWQQFVSLVEHHMPGLPAQFEEVIRQQEQDRERLEAERRDRERRDPERLPLAECLQQFLDRSDLTVVHRMRSMGHLCAARWWSVGVRGVEDEPELPDELWQRVLEAFLLGLDACEPTPIPQAEGTAFSHLACSPDYAPRLTESMIRRWLPVALSTHISTDWTQVTRACWVVSQPATEQVLVEAVANEVRRSEQPILLGSIPSECWTEALTQQFIALIRDDSIKPRARRKLLEQLVARCPEWADKTASSWAARAVEAGDADQLRQAGRNVLLVRNPSAVFDLLESDFATRGTAALEELPVLWGRRDELHVHWEQWSVDLLERLGRLLLRGFPPANDPDLQGGFVTPPQELRDLREQLLTHLLYQPEPKLQEALDRLANMDPSVQDRVANHRASEKAGRLMPTVNPSAVRDPHALSVSEAVRLLDRDGYRLIRSGNDLLDAVLESLRLVQADVGHDLPMLYNAPNRAREGKQPRKHLEEDALQVYLRRRLLAVLFRIVDEVDVQIVREDQVARRQRFDLRVTAPCHGTRQLTTVVIEVKWSTNDETRTGLVSQLGERYLLGERLTHGVFLVGWSGKWSPGDGSRGNTDVRELQRFLTNQRDDFCRTGERGAGLQIEPFILDVQWEQPDGHRDTRAAHQINR